MSDRDQKKDDDQTVLMPAPPQQDDAETVMAPPPWHQTEDEATRLAPQPSWNRPLEPEQTLALEPNKDQSWADETLMVSPEASHTLLQPHMTLAQGDQAIKSSFEVGDLIRGRFRLEMELGRGGMGIVYIASDLRKEEAGDQDSLIAIKLLTDKFRVRPEALRLLQQETRKAQTLAHPNIVTVFDFDRDGDTVYMTMEYLSGMPLDDYIQHHGAQSLEDILPILKDIASGLQYAHERGIIHSDLKPANIFITDEGRAKILDFGIARAISEHQEKKMIALTPKYASPEMFEAAPPDPRDDIYALACITYELLSGEHPFAGYSSIEAREQQWTPKPIKGLKEKQWRALLKGLAFDREERTASVEEFLQAFLPPQKNPWRWATGITALAVILISAYFMLKPPEAPPLNPEQQAKLEQELEIARQHWEVGNLGTALENYKMILALPPYDQNPPGGDFVQRPLDPQASADLKQLLNDLVKEAKAAIEEGYPEDALAFVEAGLQVDPEHKKLKRLKQKLEASLNQLQ